MSGFDSPASDAVNLLVLGLGNVLCGDDGLGPAAVARLERERRTPAHTLLLDGGTLGLSLLPLLEDAGDVILIDAVAADAPPGTPIRIDGEGLEDAVRERLSVHQVGVADVLDALRMRGRMPRRMLLLGRVPESIELRLGLSPTLAASLEALVGEVVVAARDWGYEFAERSEHEARPPASLATVALGL
jgi:hydrogenase maturation protease